MGPDPATFEFAEKCAAFLNGLLQSGATYSDKISLEDLRHRNSGWGVIAIEDIAEDEVLFSIPRSAILSASNSKLPQKLLDSDGFQNLDPWLSLILVMIYEHNRGSDSPWKPYFDILPRAFDTLMFWTDDELAELQASAVLDKIGKKAADDSFREHLVPIISKYPEFFSPNSDAHSTEEILELAHRMGSTVMAYAFDIEPENVKKEVDEEGYASEDEDEALPKGMVPLADMLNADAERNNARLFYEPDALVMKALKPIRNGEEIFNDYGPLPRSDLLRRYGYITPNYAQYDVVEIPQALIVELAKEKAQLGEKEVEERLSYLDEQGVLESGYDITHAFTNAEPEEAIPPELAVLAATLLLPAEDFRRLASKEKLPKPKMTSQVAQLLRGVVQKRAAQYKTTIEEDRAILTAGKVTGRRKMAVEVRSGEKQILEAVHALLERFAAEENGQRAHGTEGPASKKRRIE